MPSNGKNRSLDLSQNHFRHVCCGCAKLRNGCWRVEIHYGDKIRFIQIFCGFKAKSFQCAIYDTHFHHLFKPYLNIEIIVFSENTPIQGTQQFTSVVRAVVINCIVDYTNQLILKWEAIQFIRFTEMIRKLLDDLFFVLFVLLP